MKGDIIVLEEHHKKAASVVVPHILDKITAKPTRYTLTVAGESGSGKSETAKAIAEELGKYDINAAVLGQDDYFVLSPRVNDARRREDPEWLGPHVEVRLDVLERNLIEAIQGKTAIVKPLIEYENPVIGEETISLEGVKVVIAEGTYTSLLKHVDTRVFIARNRLETLAHRKKRDRAGEADDPFIEQVLVTEHKIIAGHKQLADFVITSDYGVVVVD